MATLKMTDEEYFADKEHLDCTAYKDFTGTIIRSGCEARAKAAWDGELIRPKSIALMAGSYVDAALTGDFNKFKREHPEIISQKGPSKGQIKSDYRIADAMIERCLRDEVFMDFMDGDKQVVMTGEIEGVPVKIKVDVLRHDRICDLKTVKSISDTFYAADLGERVDFVEAYGYNTQGAIYREIVRQNTGDTLPFYLNCVTKDAEDREPHPRLAIIHLPDRKLDEELENVKRRINAVWAVLNGDANAIPCGKCLYCADTLPLLGPIEEDQLILGI